MKSIKTITFLFFSLILAGCGNTPINETGISLKPSDKEAILIYTKRDIHSDTFREVDMENKRFKSEKFRISGLHCSVIPDNNQNKGMFRYCVKKVSAGDYAMISKYSKAGNTYTTSCYSRGTVVIRLLPGKVNYIDTLSTKGPWVYKRDKLIVGPDKMTRKKFIEEYIQKNPNINADVIAKGIIDKIKFKATKSNFMRSMKCPSDPKFESIK